MIAKHTIRRATVNDVQEVLHLIDSGRKIMIASGNTHQWDDNHPSRGQIAKDIANGDSCLLLEDVKPSPHGHLLKVLSPHMLSYTMEHGLTIDLTTSFTM